MNSRRVGFFIFLPHSVFDVLLWSAARGEQAQSSLNSPPSSVKSYHGELIQATFAEVTFRHTIVSAGLHGYRRIAGYSSQYATSSTQRGVLRSAGDHSAANSILRCIRRPIKALSMLGRFRQPELSCPNAASPSPIAISPPHPETSLRRCRWRVNLPPAWWRCRSCRAAA